MAPSRALRLAATGLALTLTTIAMPARADEAPADEEADPDDPVPRARELFREGSVLAGQALWARALAKYEQADAIAPHASITYNMGVCERALGRGTRAREAFRRALKQHEASDEPALADSIRETIEAYLLELDRVTARLTVTLVPRHATISVDGRPLARRGDRFVAGLRPPGPATSPQRKRLTIELDPGPHVVIVASPGFGEAVLREHLRPGARETRDLTLAKLPGQLIISADREKAAVAIDGLDVGVAPVTLKRPAGAYHIEVRRSGFEPYLADVTLEPAAAVELNAVLAPETIGLHERWWFWTSIGAALATAAVVTYFVVRPEPEQPPLDGGGLGWTIRVP